MENGGEYATKRDVCVSGEMVHWDSTTMEVSVCAFGRKFLFAVVCASDVAACLAGRGVVSCSFSCRFILFFFSLHLLHSSSSIASCRGCCAEGF